MIKRYYCCLYSCNPRTYASFIMIATFVTLLKLDRYRTIFIIDQSNCNSTNTNISGKNILYKYNYIFYYYYLIIIPRLKNILKIQKHHNRHNNNGNSNNNKNKKEVRCNKISKRHYTTNKATMLSQKFQSLRKSRK